MRPTRRLASLLLSLASLLGCGAPAVSADAPDTSPALSEPKAPGVAPRLAPDDALGGQLFDRWYSSKDFAPDDKKTAEVADGRGGPFNNGTLARADGSALLNAGGHDYRLKNLFGWDLRGSEGIYGPKYQNKAYVLGKNLLAGKGSIDEVVASIERGSEESPAYGAVLSGDEIKALAAFIVGVRDGALPRPEQIWSLSDSSPGKYTLVAGGDPARGGRIVRERCAGCHGDDGTKLLFDDDEYSLGSHGRQKAYEDWLKILNGQPGTEMGRRVRGSTGREMAQEILDILAALCDRTTFPKGKATAADVPDGDPRCGPYLK